MLNMPLTCYTTQSPAPSCDLIPTHSTVLQISHDERALITAILIEVCDLASSLWYWPDRDYRPHQLNLPAVYFEKNIERAFTQGGSNMDRSPAQL